MKLNQSPKQDLNKKMNFSLLNRTPIFNLF